MDDRTNELPPRQQLAAAGKWPIVGERSPLPWDGEWQIEICGQVRNSITLTLDELLAMPSVEAEIDIHCVTRWSKLGSRFTGVRLADIVARAEPTSDARFVSFVAHTERNHSTSLPLVDALALETLIVWKYDGQPLETCHGGPVRVVIPERYFYKSLKWLRTIELLADDRLGYWESEAGYHNHADPWLEQRYMAPSLSRQQMQTVLASRDFSRRDLRGLDARHHDLNGLNAQDAFLRDADFSSCQLEGARFNRANLSNARFKGADLRGASFVAADVEGADFVAADLRGADFTGASTLGGTFVDSTVDPRGARIDRTTRFDEASLANLAHQQAEYVRQSIQLDRD